MSKYLLLATQIHLVIVLILFVGVLSLVLCRLVQLTWRREGPPVRLIRIPIKLLKSQSDCPLKKNCPDTVLPYCPPGGHSTCPYYQKVKHGQHEEENCVGRDAHEA